MGMYNFFSNLRMRTQILILYIVIVGITILLLGMTFYVQYLILDEMFIASQQLVQKQNSQHLEATVERQFKFVQQRQYENLFRTQNINEYYQFIQEQSDFTSKLPEKCLEKEIFNKQKYIIPQITYAFYNTSNNEDIIDAYYTKLHQLTSVLNSYYLILDSYESRLYFVSTTDAQYTSNYPSSYIYPNFYPHNRSWYTNHIKRYEESNNSLEYCYSDIFKGSLSQSQTVTLTHSLFNRNSSLDGVIGYNINISDDKMQSTPYNILMMNNEGQIILNRVEQFINTTNLNYIYNSDVTGFNMEDWEQIRFQSKTRNGISNCKTNSENYLCRFNTYYQQDVQIAARFFDDGTNFTLILVSNISYNNQLEEQFNVIKDQVQMVITYQIQIQVFVSVLFLGISVGLVIIIFKPIYEIMHIAKNHIKNVGNNINVYKFKILNNQMKNQGKIESLKFSFLNIYDIIDLSRRQKSDTCKLIEKFKYPIKELINHGDQLENQLQLKKDVKSLKNGQEMVQGLSFTQRMILYVSKLQNSI